MHYFNVNQLNTLTRYALYFTDFDTEGLSRDTECSDASQNITTDFIHTILLSISTLCIECFESGKSINEEVIKRHLNFNSHDWCRILKFTFQHTTLVDKTHNQGERNWVHLSEATMRLCFTEANMNDSAEDSAQKDDLFSKYIKYPNISGEFKNFIGQLIKDGCVKEAQAIHNMLKYSRKISTNPNNGVNAEKLSKMISTVFFMGLEILEGYQKNNTKQKVVSTPQPELYANYLIIFTPGFTVVLEDKIFSEEFSTELYLGCGQEYQQSVMKKSLTDVMTGVITDNLAKLTLSSVENRLSRKKSVESKSEIKVAELKYSSGTVLSTSSKCSSLSHIATSPRIINSSGITTDAESTSPINSPKSYELEIQSITDRSKESFDFEHGPKVNKLRKSESPIRKHKNSVEHRLKKSDKDLPKTKHKLEMPIKEKEYDIGQENNSSPLLIKHTKKSPRRNAIDVFSAMGSDNEFGIHNNSTEIEPKMNAFKNSM